MVNLMCGVSNIVASVWIFREDDANNNDTVAAVDHDGNIPTRHDPRMSSILMCHQTWTCGRHKLREHTQSRTAFIEQQQLAQ